MNKGDNVMVATDPFGEHYADLLDGTYDCVDRIVLNGYFLFIQSGGGFRSWWRSVFGDENHLDNAHLMRWAGRFARRIRKVCEVRRIPILEKGQDDRMHQIVEELRPTDPEFKGVFAISVHRAPASLWEVIEYASGEIHLQRKTAWVNQWAFHILDPDWGHLTIKVCPHPPFHVQVILNGHEYVARQAAQQNIRCRQEGNCFTDSSNLTDFAQVAETSRSVSAKGHLQQVCERWLYSACLCFLMPVAEQQRVGLHYDWSVYQMEFSHNLLFSNGHQMEAIFQSLIDRTRSVLRTRTIRTVFGRTRRPFYRQRGKPNFEVVIERPAYDLTVFKVHCGLLTLKIYTKGERVLRIEAIVHNAKKEFVRGYGIDHYPAIAEALRSMVERFLTVLRSVDACWVSDETWDRLPEPSQVGRSRVSGVDLNRPRMRAVIQGVLALSTRPGGFRCEQLAEQVREILGESYTARQASYDLKKLRGKQLVHKIKQTRHYQSSPQALRSMVALVLLREKVIAPMLAGTHPPRRRRPRNARGKVDRQYQVIQYEMQKLFTLLGIAA
jgi:hypothetical protein